MLGMKRKSEEDAAGRAPTAAPDPWKKHRRRLRARRAVALFVILWIIIGIVWLVKFSGLLDPVLEMAAPGYNTVVSMINDPLGIDYGGALINVASIFILHIGMLMFIFERR